MIKKQVWFSKAQRILLVVLLLKILVLLGA